MDGKGFSLVPCTAVAYLDSVGIEVPVPLRIFIEAFFQYLDSLLSDICFYRGMEVQYRDRLKLMHQVA